MESLLNINTNKANTKEREIINQNSMEQMMCEIMDIFHKYKIKEYYKFIFEDKTYDCFDGLKYEKLDPYDWDENCWDYGFNILIESEVEFMFNNEPEYLHEVLDFESDMETSENYIRCMSKLRRIFKRYGMEWKVVSQGYMITFKNIEGGK